MANIVLNANESFTIASGNTGRVFGTASSSETVTVRRGATAELQADFTAHWDVVKIDGNAEAYSLTTSGATVTISDGATRVALPAGPAPTDVVFADARLPLRLAAADNQEIRLGETDITGATNADLPGADGGHGGLPVRALTPGVDELSGDALDNAFLARPGTVQDADVVRGGRGFDVLRVQAESAPFTLGPDLSLPEFDLSGVAASPSSQAITIAPGVLDGALFREGVIDLSGDTNAKGQNVVDVSSTGQFGKPGARAFDITGSAGPDRLTGGGAPDRIVGGPGKDTLTGNGGEDTFAGSLAGLDQDTITDFTAGDRIHLTQIALDELQVTTEPVDRGLDVVLEGPETTATVTLENASGTVLTEPAVEGGVAIRPGGEKFQLTAEADDVVEGTDLPDTIVAPPGTLQADDTVDGQGGTDRLQLAPDGAAYTIGPGAWRSLASVEHIQTTATAAAIDLTFGADLNDAGVHRIDLAGDTANGGENTIDLSSLDVAADAVRQFLGSAGDDRVFLGTDRQVELLTYPTYQDGERQDGLLDGGPGQDTLSFARSQDPNEKDIDLDDVAGFEVFVGSDTSDRVSLGAGGFDELRTGDGADSVRLGNLRFDDEGGLVIGENAAPAPSRIDLGSGPAGSDVYDADSLDLNLSEVTPADLETFDVSQFATGLDVLKLRFAWSDAPETVAFTTDPETAAENTVQVQDGLSSIQLEGATAPAVGTYDFSGIARDASSEDVFRIDTQGLSQQAELTVHGTDGADRIIPADNAREDIIRGGGGDDRIDGDLGADELYGDGENDQLVGGEGDDTLYGGQGQDVLNGREGNDILNGGSGSDELRGFSGADEFEVAFGQKDPDTIQDYAPSEGDTIDFTGASDVAGVADPDTFKTYAAPREDGSDFGANFGFIVVDNAGSDIGDAPGLTPADVETYLTDIEAGSGETKLLHGTNTTEEVFYLAVSDGRETGVFRVDAAGGDGDLQVDAGAISQVIRLQGVESAGTLTAAQFEDFTA